MHRYSIPLWIMFTMILSLSHTSASDAFDLPKPKSVDTCPVCGMFVVKYPAWVASVLYRNDHAHHFDGAKDLFKYLLDMPKWAPAHRAVDIEKMGVTEYYGLRLIDAKAAYYVIGSDVLGPMGHELIPLASREDAEEFLQDHLGHTILRFDQVTLEILHNLDKGNFE